MNYSEHRFRPLYKNYCMLQFNDAIRDFVQDKPGSANSDGVLVYGYADHEQGILLEVIAFAHMIEDKKVNFAPLQDDVKITIPLKNVINEEFDFIAYGNATVHESFKKRVDDINMYEKDAKWDGTRIFEYLDEFRHTQNMDDVMVLLNKEGLTPEGCWVRIEGLGDNCFIGKLLNEPEQDFGYHAGEEITFFVRANEEGSLSLIADLNNVDALYKDMLETGEVLREKIKAFNKNHSVDNLLNVLQIAKMSYVWILCAFEQGSTDKIAKPDVLKMNDKCYFPVFTWNKDLGEYGKVLTKVKQTFKDAIIMAKNNDPAVDGIVIDAFTDALIIPKEMFDMIEQMKD